MKLSNQTVSIFLAFSGEAKEAMNFYQKVLPNTRIDEINYFSQTDIQGDAGKVLSGILSVKESKIIFMDMPAKNPAPKFSWAITPLIQFETQAEFDSTFIGLKNGGIVMMGPEKVLNMRKCAWVTDKFGVTWQLVWI